MTWFLDTISDSNARTDLQAFGLSLLYFILSLIFQYPFTSCLVKGEMFRAIRSPFPRSIPGPRRSVLDEDGLFFIPMERRGGLFPALIQEAAISWKGIELDHQNDRSPSCEEFRGFNGAQGERRIVWSWTMARRWATAGSSGTWRMAWHGGFKSYELGQSHRKGTKKENARTRINSLKKSKTRWQRSSMPLFFRGKCQFVS